MCCTELQISSLCLDVLALEEGLRAGVSKAVLVPERAGGLRKLDLRGALVISKEPWEKNTTEYVVLTTKKSFSNTKAQFKCTNPQFRPKMSRK